MDAAVAGPGLIETLRVQNGRIPFLERHAERLARSLAELDLPRPKKDLATLVAPHADGGDALVRVEVRDGRASLARRAVRDADPVRMITASVAHAPYRHKTTVRGAFERAAAEAWAAGADEALLLTPGKLVAEATVWSVFWWDGESLRTPALALHVLPGVARARIGELVAVTEAWSGRGELAGKSLFLANAGRGIVPVATLDGERVPMDRRTAELARRFWAVPVAPEQGGA